MKRVLDEIDIRCLADDKYILLDDFEYHVGSEDSDEIITVEKMFVTDFASVPRFAWSIVPPMGRIKPAALVHDFLYFLLGKNPGGKTYSRKQCDDIFYEIMSVIRMPRHEKWFAYSAVRTFGWIGWERRKKQVKGQK